MPNLPAIPTGVSITSTGLTLPEALSETDWSAIGEQLKASEVALQWSLGDWYVYGTESKYGRVSSIAESLGWASSTLKNVATVCRNIPTANRRTDLSFTHHQEVSHLSEGEQATILQEAADRGLSARETRRLARGLPAGGESTSPAEGVNKNSALAPAAGSVNSKWSKEETLEERAIGLVQEAVVLLEDAADLLQRTDFRITVNVGQSLIASIGSLDVRRTEILESIESEVGTLLEVPA